MTTTFPLAGLDGITPCHVIPRAVTHADKQGLRLELTPDAETPDCPNFALIDGLAFRDGTIEVELAGRPLPDAPPGARGFVGIAFRIAADLSQLECIYLRPTNGRADEQLRRDAPGEYETYVDLISGAWTKMRIEVTGAKAWLFVDGAEQPTLIVNDLKHGSELSGGIGLYIDSGTEGYFRELRVSSG